MSTWTGTNYWDRGAIPQTTKDDLNDSPNPSLISEIIMDSNNAYAPGDVQPGDSIIRGSNVPVSDKGGQVTGWTRDKMTGVYTGTTPTGKQYKSTVKPNIAKRERPELSQAGLLSRLNTDIFKSIEGYHNQLRTDADRAYQRDFPKYRQPSWRELGFGSVQAYEKAWRDAQSAGGTRPSVLSEKQRQYQSGYGLHKDQFNSEHMKSIDAIESSRDKAMYTAEVSALKRNHALEAQMLKARNAPLKSYGQHGKTNKSLDVASQVARFTGFVRPEGKTFQSRKTEAEQYWKGFGSQKLILDEQMLADAGGASSEYTTMARTAVDLLNASKDGVSTYNQIMEKAMLFEKANANYELSLISKSREAERQEAMNDKQQREQLNKSMPTDAGDRLFNAPNGNKEMGMY